MKLFRFGIASIATMLMLQACDSSTSSTNNTPSTTDTTGKSNTGGDLPWKVGSVSPKRNFICGAAKLGADSVYSLSVVDDAFQLSISSYTRKPGTYPFKPAVIGVSTHDAVTSQYIGYTAPTAAWNDPKGAVTLKTTGTNTIFQFDYTLNKDSVHVTGTFDCSAQTGLAGNGAGLGNLK